MRRSFSEPPLWLVRIVSKDSAKPITKRILSPRLLKANGFAPWWDRAPRVSTHEWIPSLKWDFTFKTLLFLLKKLVCFQMTHTPTGIWIDLYENQVNQFPRMKTIYSEGPKQHKAAHAVTCTPSCAIIRCKLLDKRKKPAMLRPVFCFSLSWQRVHTGMRFPWPNKLPVPEPRESSHKKKHQQYYKSEQLTC